MSEFNIEDLDAVIAGADSSLVQMLALQLKKQIGISKASEQQLAAVVAENAGLKNAVDIIETKYMNWEGLSDAFSDARGIKTPATDAAIAKIQAQGVEMFANAQNKIADDEAVKGNVDLSLRYRGMSLAADRFAAQLRQGAAL